MAAERALGNTDASRSVRPLGFNDWDRLPAEREPASRANRLSSPRDHAYVEGV